MVEKIILALVYSPHLTADVAPDPSTLEGCVPIAVDKDTVTLDWYQRQPETNVYEHVPQATAWEEDRLYWPLLVVVEGAVKHHSGGAVVYEISKAAQLTMDKRIDRKYQLRSKPQSKQFVSGALNGKGSKSVGSKRMRS